MSDCLEYTAATAVIYFEKGEERCCYCPLLETYSRNMCRKTGEYVVNIKGRGRWCPLVFEEVFEERTEDGKN